MAFGSSTSAARSTSAGGPPRVAGGGRRAGRGEGCRVGPERRPLDGGGGAAARGVERRLLLQPGVLGEEQPPALAPRQRDPRGVPHRREAVAEGGAPRAGG